MIIGIVVTILFLLEPIIGWLHHRHFLAKGTKNYKRQVHVWLGRLLLVLGATTGGTGLKLADNTTGGGIAYGIIAAIVVVIYIGVWFWSKRQQKAETEKNEARDNAVVEMK